MPTPQDPQSALEAAQTELRQMEVHYLRAKAFLDSPEWQAKRDDTLMRIQAVVAPYQGKDPTEAVFILGKVKEIMLAVQEPTDIIVRYEDKKKRLESYYQTRG